MRMGGNSGGAAGPTNPVVVDGPAATLRRILFESSGSLRWELDGADDGAESGGNSGSDFILWATQDDGITQGAAFKVIRAPGGVFEFFRNVRFGGTDLGLQSVIQGLFLDVAAKTFANSPGAPNSISSIRRWNTGGGNCVENLPTAVGRTGLLLAFLKTTADLNTLTITPNGAELLGGVNGSIVLRGSQACLLVVSNGAGWDIVAHYRGVGRWSNAVQKFFADSPYTVLDSDESINYDASGGGSTVNLPTPVGRFGRRIRVVKNDGTANQVNLVTAAGTIGVGGAANFPLLAPGDALELESDNANWTFV